MKVLFGMNMGSGANDLTHQVVGLVPFNTLPELMAHMEEHNFLMIKQLFYRTSNEGRRHWTVRGDMILNIDHIGKVTQYIDQSE